MKLGGYGLFQVKMFKILPCPDYTLYIEGARKGGIKSKYRV